MRVGAPASPHLTYCTNIHAGESLSDVREAVLRHVTQVKRAVCPRAPFGVGLRLSARASSELSEPGALDAFRALLDEQDLYVFTINGFPFGAFHAVKVKEAVYRPDWLEQERVDYSDRLARQLASLLPEGVSGSVSTVPGAFRPRLGVAADERARGEERLVEHLLAHAAMLFRVREETGKLVELCLEPEPFCFLETTEETVQFFEARIFSRAAVRIFAARTGLDEPASEAFLRRHLSMCLDACHLAVQFEDASDALARLDASGVRIGKVQVTCALAVALSGDRREDERIFGLLEPFADEVYLHQVVERSIAGFARYLDLPDALRAIRATDRRTPSEWRIHFHVPVFAHHLGALGSTQPFVRDLLALAAKRSISSHYEVETYTWDVLPVEHRTTDVNQAIARELEWTLAHLVAEEEK
jgi:sugar phosphate isomerase/epimerase